MREPVGLILAGGRANRMGGLSKAALELGRSRLLDHVIDRFEPQVGALAVSANTVIETDLPQLPDETDEFLGPLAGVRAGLDWAARAGAGHLVSVAVDTPFFPCDLVPRLILAGDGGLAVASTQDGPQGVFAIWPVDIREPLSDFLNQGGRKVRHFLTRHGAAEAHFPQTTPPSFFNINTPEDLTEATRWI